METGFIPAETKKSTSTDFTFVCPDLKSSPPINVFCRSANSMAPGTKVFWGDPLMYVHWKKSYYNIFLCYYKIVIVT